MEVGHAEAVSRSAGVQANPTLTRVQPASIQPSGQLQHRVPSNRPESIRRPAWMRHSPAVSAVILLLACGLVHVWVRLQVTKLGYGLSTIREIVARLEHEQRELETELAMLTAPEQLAEEARRRLQMREPKAGQVVVIR
jgi:cell division protein FtsL